MTRSMYDAAWPPPDPHLDVCAFYIGGDTPHVWTDDEINGQSARWRLPIYVCDNPQNRDPVADSAKAIAWLRAHSVPQGSSLALDYEVAVDSTYEVDFDSEVRSAGYALLLYGTRANVEQNRRPSAGYWTATWNGIPHLDAGASATQWASDAMLDKPYDLSEVSDSLVLWDTRPPAPSAPPTLLMEDDLHQIDSLARNPEGQYAWGVGALGGQGSVTLSWDGGVNGYTGDAQVRLVVWDKNGYHITDVDLPNSGGKVQTPFPDPASTYLVTASRIDSAPSPIGVAIP